LPFSTAPQILFAQTQESTERRDWDTGTPYIEMQFYGENILNVFRQAHFAQIEAALAAILAHQTSVAVASLNDPAPPFG